MTSCHRAVQKAFTGRASFVAVIASLLCCAVVAAAPTYGATVTVGPQLPLQNPFGAPIGCEGACTVANSQLPFGASFEAPISGVIVRWRLFGADHLGAGYRIRVIKHLSEGSGPYLGLRSGPLQFPASQFETFPANLPIQAGQMVALNLESERSVLGFESNSGASALLWEPPIRDKELRGAPEGEGLVFGFNADIQPPPTIAYLASVKGSINGGTEVAMTGTDFTGATAVLFGAVPAASFRVDSDESITAVSPPSATPGTVPVSVTTPAGVATSQFRYLACIVPKLKKRSLKAAKVLLRAGHCHIGRVLKLRDAKARTAEVSSQKPKPGSVLTPGSRVRVTLRPRS